MSFQKGGLFSEKEIQKMASPERLDTLVVVTKRRGWIALAAVCILILELLVWAIFGRLPITVNGKGILLKDRVVDIEAGAEGRVVDLLIPPGGRVEEGQVVATLDLSGIKTDLKLKTDTLTDLEAEDQRASPLEELERQAKIVSLEQEQQALPGQVSRAEEVLNGRVAEYEQAVKNKRNGLVTEAQVNQALAAQSSAEQELQRLKNRMIQIPAELANVRTSMSEKTQSRRLQIAQLQREVRELNVQLESGTSVRSHVGGIVLEHMVDRANLVTAKDRIMTVEPDDSTMEAVVYVDAKEAKKIPVSSDGKPVGEIPARISPSTVKPEEFGFMLGEVRVVAAYPATPEGMERVLRNQTFIQELTEDGAPIEVRASLYISDNTVSGFDWSSSKGPDIGIASGTICEGKFEVARKRPISYVIPMIKKTVGIK